MQREREMKVKCSYTSIRAVKTLKPYPNNPNHHPDVQIQMLAKIIEHSGWRLPIVVSKRSNLITKGHGRLEAAKLLGLKTVPVDLQEYATKEEEIADMLADNKIAELSSLELEPLEDAIGSLLDSDPDFDIELAGFNKDELDDILGDTEPPDDFKKHDFNVTTNHKCPKCGYEWSDGKKDTKSQE